MQQYLPALAIMQFEDGDLNLEQKEAIAAKILESLPAESKARLLQKELGGSGLVVLVGGSNCSINSDVAVHIQSASNVDVGEILEALVNRRKKDRGER